jgi:hypothetical protein
MSALWGNKQCHDITPVHQFRVVPGFFALTVKQNDVNIQFLIPGTVEVADFNQEAGPPVKTLLGELFYVTS